MLNFIRHLFLPHHTNNHKAKVLHHSSFISYILLAVAIQLVFQIVMITRPQVLGIATDISADKLLQLVNQERIQNGLTPLKLDSELSQAASLKAADMFAKNYWSHFAPNGTTPWDFINQTGYHYLYAGENLARDFATSDQVVIAWMNSATHRANILNANYHDMGLAVVNGKLGSDQTTLVVELFGTRQSSAPTVSSAAIEQPQALAAKTQSVQNPSLGQNNQTINTAPKLNVLNLSKDFSYLLVLFLLVMLVVDAYLVKKKKIIRASGNNFAHMAILIFLLLAIYVTQTGAIL